MELARVKVGDRVKIRTVLTEIEGVIEGIRPRGFVVRFPFYKGTEKEWRIVKLKDIDEIKVLPPEGLDDDQ